MQTLLTLACIFVLAYTADELVPVLFAVLALPFRLAARVARNIFR